MNSVFIGYTLINKAYELLDDELGAIVECRDMEFFEDNFSRDVENSNPIIAPQYFSRKCLTLSSYKRTRQKYKGWKRENLGDDFYS